LSFSRDRDARESVDERVYNNNNNNNRAMLHDESVYPEPSRFMPERYLDPNLKPPEAVFGFGRRICPGRFMARSSMWITIASVLAAFDISPVKDADGVSQIPKEEYTAGSIS
jgi:cytochrome P450